MADSHRRIKITVDVRVPYQEQSAKDALDWLQRFFAFYHPSLDAKIDSKSLAVVEPPLSDEEAALL